MGQYIEIYVFNIDFIDMRYYVISAIIKYRLFFADFAYCFFIIIIMTHRQLWSVATTLHDVHVPRLVIASACCYSLIIFTRL